MQSRKKAPLLPPQLSEEASTLLGVALLAQLAFSFAAALAGLALFTLFCKNVWSQNTK
jgi:uncharacterized membrane protein YqjE